MTIEAKVIAHSQFKLGPPIATLQVTYPRFLLPEMNTHRVFSRNYSSSRAIPTAKLVEQVRTNPAMPIHWGKNQPGMQADSELEPVDVDLAKKIWMSSARLAADQAEEMAALGAHKQIVNRILEPYLHVTGVITSTEWSNFFGLRAHPDAQPEIQALAVAMRDALEASTPNQIQHYEWHLPYITDDERDWLCTDAVNGPLLPYISAARCCRVSYLKHDGTSPSVEEDMKLCNRLLEARPIHASPFEHQAQPDADYKYSNLWGNLYGWKQFRKSIEQNLNWNT